MSSSFSKRVNKEIMLCQKENFCFPNLIVKPSEDLHVWYFIIHGLIDTDYQDGMYIGKVLLPDKYPFSPPDFIFLTESGRFEINKKICTSFTGFHQDLYSPSWNISSMLIGLVSFMTDSQETKDSEGLAGIKRSREDRQTIAKASIEVVKNHPIYKQYFAEFSTALKFTN
jgi:ubiquitin-protein ligase